MWDGAFSPILRKSVGTVRYVPLVDMTLRDWEWLDYDNIRTVARNRIASALVRGQLRGFFQVMLTQKAAKLEYFWPATPADIQQFAESGEADFFRHQSEVDNENSAVENVERLRQGIRYLPLATLIEIINGVRSLTDEETAEYLDRIDLGLLESGGTPREILIASLMLWEMSLEESLSILEEVPEGDEVDEVRDWLDDRFAEIEAARRTLAAGRGLTGSR